MTLLGEYLHEVGTSQIRFAEKIQAPASLVSTWANGLRRPGLANALKIEAATGGRVPASYWAAFEVETRHSAPPSRAPPVRNKRQGRTRGKVAGER